MAVLKILTYPNKMLRAHCAEVETVTDAERKLLDDMAETMYAAPGIGLAAPQVGVLRRLLVVDVGSCIEGDESVKEGKSSLYKMINPEILLAEGATDTEEGCLSLPGVRESVRRPDKIQVKALNENAEEIVMEAEGLLAVCVQHEIDHLNGVLFIDHLSRLKRQMINSKLKKLAK